MKKLLISVLLIFFSFSYSKAQWVGIPDSNFVYWLQLNEGACMNSPTGNLLNTACPLLANTTTINCSGYSIATLDGIQYFVNLQILDCSNNAIVTLPPLASSLLTLSCGYNSLTVLPTLAPSLVKLSCHDNQLTNLPTMPSSLTELACYGNQLTSLPSLPTTLTILDCTNNQLTSLPSLPSTLVTLDCGENKLTTLPYLPGSLTSLGCPNNQLSNLPSLPTSISNLDCEYNNLTSLPTLPDSLFSLSCAYNQLSYLPDLPDSMSGLFIEGNPNLTCLPHLGKINDFIFNNTGITCLPDTIGIENYFPDIHQYPICDSAFEHGCNLQILSGIAPVNVSTVNIYPNPAADKIFISGNFLPDRMEITNLLGVTLIRQYTQTSADKNTINISALTSGVYFITLYYGNQEIVRKIIKD